VLQQKKQAIPDLRSTFREATRRFEEASKAREQKKKADELKKELAWAHVAAKEDVNLLTYLALTLADNTVMLQEMRQKIEDAAKMSRRLPKIEENVANADVCFTTFPYHHQ
jgi:hypothetical protein